MYYTITDAVTLAPPLIGIAILCVREVAEAVPSTHPTPVPANPALLTAVTPATSPP